ncbi:MAG: hypothetical protein ACXVA8_09880, partial [Bdellovibrionota bacterium]
DPCPGIPFKCAAPQISFDPNIITMRDFLLAKVVWSNFATLRPGSLYELRVHFEENAGFPRPTFNYLFSDTGLGAAEPLYSVYESGFQASYLQLLQSAAGEAHRHIDHFSDMVTPEGCRVQSVYIIRSMQAFPDMWQQERADGYTLVDISWDYTTRLKPNAECGRHRSSLPDPNFDPIAAIKPYLKNFHSMSDIPSALLAKYEAKINLEKTVVHEESSIFSPKHWTTYAQQYSYKANSLWYYPDGHAEDYGVNTPHPQPGYRSLSIPRDFLIPASDALAQALPLSQTITAGEFEQYKNFLNGHPTPNFQASQEPGGDAFSLSQITTENFLTAGKGVYPIANPRGLASTVEDPSHYRLVEGVIRPSETEVDFHHPDGINLPEMRLVYQWVGEHNYEQVFVHLTYNAVDRAADPATRLAQEKAFLGKWDQLNELRQSDPTRADADIAAFLRDTIAARPVASIAFSSSLTGIWIFGQLTRAYNANGDLVADNITRHGINVGYYSSAYDNQLFRDAAAAATGERKAELQDVLDTLTPATYRDPRRNDVSKIKFGSVTCAQCHQMSGRDGIHVRLNDGIDSRTMTREIASEYLYHEIQRQLMLVK